MPGLIWFEWTKCPDGYTVETFEEHYAEYTDMFRDGGKWWNTVKEAESHSSRSSAGSLIARPAKQAPGWVKIVLSPGVFDAQHIGEQFVVPKSKSVLTFFPLEENEAAFMEFASCHESCSNLLHFVEKYGMPYRNPNNLPFWLENLQVEPIQENAADMAETIKIWEKAIATNDFDWLVRIFDGRVTPWDELDEYDLEAGEPPLAVTHVHLRPRTDRKGPPILSLAPEDLESALWLQFAQAVSGNMRLRRCAVCPTWFSYGTGPGRRKSAHYCSDRCRKAAHRAQKKTGTGTTS